MMACTCPDAPDNELYRMGYIEHPSMPLVDDPACKRCFPFYKSPTRAMWELAGWIGAALAVYAAIIWVVFA